MKLHVTAGACAIALAVLFLGGCTAASEAPDGGAPDGSTDGGADGSADGSTDGGVRNVVVKTESMVPMRDGAKLNTRVYLPSEIPAGGLPAVFERTPYGFPSDEEGFDTTGAYFVSLGYAYLLQDVRGRFKSEGVFEPMKNEFADGFDATAWIVKQPWSSGKIGTWGGSYTGFTAVATAVDNPLVSVVIADDAAADFKFDFHNGVFSLHPLDWLYVLDHNDWMDPDGKAQMTNALDLATLDQTMLGHKGEFYQQLLAIEGRVSDTFWKDRTLDGRYGGLCAPLLSVLSFPTAWDDPVRIFDGARLDGCEKHRKNARLVVTSEGHCYHMSVFSGHRTPVNQLMIDYLDTYLKGADRGLDTAPQVVYHSPGEYSYRKGASWPLSDSTAGWFLHNDNPDPTYGWLSADKPGAEKPDVVALDPAVMDACTINEPYYPYFLYASEALDKDAYVDGAATVDLWISATSPDVDFFAYLLIYDGATMKYDYMLSAGMRARYRDGPEKAVLLTPNAPALLKIEFFPMTYLVPAGKSLMLVLYNADCVSSENALTGETLATQSIWGKASVRVLHDADHPSSVTLPLQEADPGRWMKDVVVLDCQ
ncbi:MAG: CocE/NonD family hydrolase, partial [Myxococcota bacterium]